jgi:hypothetical protein
MGVSTQPVRGLFRTGVYLLTSPRLVPGVRYEVLGFGAEVFQECFGGRFGVDDVGGGEPGAAELGDAVTHLVELFGGVGVGVDYDFAAVLFGDSEI